MGTFPSQIAVFYPGDRSLYAMMVCSRTPKKEKIYLLTTELLGFQLPVLLSPS